MSATKLTTARLELHPLDAERDAHALHAIRSDRRVWSTMGDSQPPGNDAPDRLPRRDGAHAAGR